MDFFLSSPTRRLERVKQVEAKGMKDPAKSNWAKSIFRSGVSLSALEYAQP